MAVFRRLAPAVRSSVAFDNDAAFARRALLRDMLAQTTYFRDAYASWQKGVKQLVGSASLAASPT